MKFENNTPLLKIEDLSVAFRMRSSAGETSDIIVVDKISFEINKGEMLAIVGESGSGKSVTALSILKLLPYPAASHPSGTIQFDDIDNLLKTDDKKLRSIRGNRISMIFQEPMTSLNPLHNIEKQIGEAITIHNPNIKKNKINERIKELLSQVGLENLANRLHSYPHELSGGQRQRVMIAMALANEPDILIADEPTTALDVTIQVQILELLKELQQQNNMAILLITHDLTIVENIADRVLVMHQGKIVETGKVKNVFANPQANYTKHLLSAAPKGNPVKPSKDAKEIISTDNLKVHFPIKKGMFGRVSDYVKAVDGVSINLKEGHTLGIVGESGSGKSTLAYAILRLISSEGKIIFNGEEIHNKNNKQMLPFRKDMQMVFQDPFASLNPRMSIEQIISEGLEAHNIGESKQERQEIISTALEDVGLEADFRMRYPHEFSGGQRQRIGIARSLVLNPKLIVLDEPTSALDLSTQAEILDILRELQDKRKLSYIFISHDLRVIKAVSHNIIVMKQGKIIEQNSCDEIFASPQSDYTKALISAAFSVK